MSRHLLMSAALIACGVPTAAGAGEPGRGFPFRGAAVECVRVDHAPRHARGDFRWFPAVLARFGGREDGCHVERLSRYGQAQSWRVLLSCPGGQAAREDWALNYDGSITANRAGSKTIYRPCEPGVSR